MRYGLMESFFMHHSDIQYGIDSSDRIELFTKAQQLGFDGIEFGLNRDYAQDPLWTGEGALREEMREASRKTGVEARSLCLHLLNYQEFSPASCQAAHRATSRALVDQTLLACSEVGVSVILVPFFGTSTLQDSVQVDHLVEEMRRSAAVAASLGITLALETSLDAANTQEVLNRIASDAVGVYFDTANGIGLGYDAAKEITSLGSSIAQVHIKEYPRAPALGSGQIDFASIAGVLHQVGYDGYLVIEQPSGDDELARANLSYLKRMVEGAQ